MERYGVELTSKLQAFIVDKIQKAEAKFLYRRSNSRTVWEVELPDGEIVSVVYSKERKDPVTAVGRKWHIQKDRKKYLASRRKPNE